MSEPSVSVAPVTGAAVARARLLQQLAQARGRRCVVVRSPAGSGKTSLLGTWRRELVAAGVDVAWVALAPEDDDPVRFFDVVLAALGKVDAALVAQARALAGRGSDDTAIEALVICLLRAIAAHPRELVLIVDDAHLLHDARVWTGLQLLLDHGPAQLQCAWSTRSVLPLALGRLRDQQQLLELQPQDLRFTADEALQLVASLVGARDEREVRALHEQADGWAAGMKLLCLDLRRSRRGEPVRDAQAFARYFEHEVLRQLAPAAVELLLHCALPQHFDAALCAALLGAPADTAGCAAALQALDGQGLFLMPAGPRQPPGWWRLHPLLRGVLEARLQALPRPRRDALHTIAWRFFAAHDMPHQAVQHALQAGAAPEAAALVESRAAGLFVRGELRSLASLVRLLPEAAVLQRPGLRLWLAWAQLYAQRLDECAHHIAALEHDGADAPPGERFRLTLLRGLLAVQRDDTDAAMAVLPALLAPPPDADGIALTGRRSLLTWIHLYRGEYDQALHIQLTEPAPLVEGQPLYGTAIGLLAGRCLAGLTLAVQGQMIQAERIYRDVLFEAERRGPGCADAGTLAAALLAEVLYELNEPAAALALLEPRIDVMAQVSIPDTRLRMMLVLARSHGLGGRPLDALDHLEQLQDYAERMGLDRLLAYALLEQLRLRLRRRELAAAREALQAVELLDARHAAVHTGTLAEIRVVAERARIELWLHTGELDRALEHLAALAALVRERGRARRVPFLLLQAAVALRQLGRHAEARAQVREALRLGHGLGLMRSLLDAHGDVPELVREAMLDDALDPVLRFYAERLDAAAREGGSSPAVPAVPARPGLEVLSPREAEIAQLLLQNLSNKKIARALDLSLDTVKWHLKNVYGKLGASGRDDVIERLRT